MQRKLIVLAASVMGFLASGAANADTNLVVNGGFETGSFSGWTLGENTGATYVQSSFAGYSPHSGIYFAALGAVGSLDYLSQTQDIATTPGDQYQVSFWLDSNGTTPNQFTASFNGVTLFDQTNIPTQPWTQYTYTVTATTTSAALVFGSRNDPSYLALDDVSVMDLGSVVPLPASVWEGVTLLGIVGAWGWRRRTTDAE